MIFYPFIGLASAFFSFYFFFLFFSPFFSLPFAFCFFPLSQVISAKFSVVIGVEQQSNCWQPPWKIENLSHLWGWRLHGQKRPWIWASMGKSTGFPHQKSPKRPAIRTRENPAVHEWVEIKPSVLWSNELHVSQGSFAEESNKDSPDAWAS